MVAGSGFCTTIATSPELWEKRGADPSSSITPFALFSRGGRPRACASRRRTTVTAARIESSQFHAPPGTPAVDDLLFAEGQRRGACAARLKLALLHPLRASELKKDTLILYCAKGKSARRLRSESPLLVARKATSVARSTARMPRKPSPSSIGISRGVPATGQDPS